MGSIPEHLGSRRRPSLAVVAALAVVVAVVVAVVHGPAEGLYFHSDDFEWLAAARAAAADPATVLPADVNAHFRPLAEAWWAVTYRAFGLAAGGYHRAALAVHASAALLVGLTAWMVAARSARGAMVPTVAAFAGAVVFAVNFAHREVATWISAAPDLLLGFCAAAAAAAFLAAGAWVWLGVACHALALTAKESAVVLVIIWPLVAPEVRRRRPLQAALAAVTFVALVVHVSAFTGSSYARERLDLGAAAGGRFVAAASGLLAPFSPSDMGPIPGVLAAADSPLRAVIGLTLLAALVALALGVGGRRDVLAWTTAALLALVLPAIAGGELESRWFYLPWVFLAPVGGLAVAGVGALAPGRWGAAAVGAAVAGHIAVHGYAIRAKIEGDRERDAWVQSIVEGAGQAPPVLATGQRVEVMVPFGSELRAWPLGIELAVGIPLEIVLIDDRMEPTPGELWLDTTVRPSRWRGAGP